MISIENDGFDRSLKSSISKEKPKPLNNYSSKNRN